MSKQSTGPRPRLPRGFSDARAEQLRLRDSIIDTVRRVYERYGFEPLETPALEYTDCLGKFLPDVDRPAGGVFSLRDDDEQWMSLRYDLTAPLARFVAENYDALPKPFRRYQIGPVWRNEKPGPGRFREFHQFDVDTVGTPTMAADAELALVLCDVFEALGFARDEVRIRISNRKLLNGILERLSEERPISDEQKGIILRAIDKLDRLGIAGVLQLLTKGRRDESGDFAKGAELTDNQVESVMTFLGYPGATNTSGDAGSEAPSAAGLSGSNEERLRQLEVSNAFGASGIEGLTELSELAGFVTAAGYGDGRVVIDPSIVRGLAYYTGPVIEAELLSSVVDERGQRLQLGSPAGGGRYDDLIMRFRGERVPATGVSIGVSRLATAMQALGHGAPKAWAGPVVVLVLDEPRRAQEMVAELRRAGIASELYLGGAGMRAQLKYADRRHAPVAVIEGADERAKGEVVLKDLVKGAEIAKQLADNKAWREEQPAQTGVKREALVEGVEAMLARQRDSRG